MTTPSQNSFPAQCDILRPPRLRLGDTVAVISPGRWISEDELRSAAKHFEVLGFRPFLHPQNFCRHHQFAGTAEQRLDAIHDVFRDDQFRAVMLAKSGNGALQLLDSLDYALIRKNVKVFVGYSDATALLIALRKAAGIVTFHGPMLYDVRERVDDLTWRSFRDVIVDAKTTRIDSASVSQARVVRPGTGTGPLVGGNLTLLANLIGTSTDFETDEHILFFEDYDEKLYSIDRLLTHLKRAGRLERLRGLVIGEMHKISDNEVPFGCSVDEIVLMHCRGTSFPIVSNCPFGHGDHQWVLPIGTRGILAANQGSFTFELQESAVT